MQNIKEANMFLFGRACVSGTLLCLEIQKAFISKAGWAVALHWAFSDETFESMEFAPRQFSRTLKAV